MWWDTMYHIHLAVITVPLYRFQKPHIHAHILSRGGRGEKGMSLNLISLSPSGAKELSFLFSHQVLHSPSSASSFLLFVFSFLCWSTEVGHVFVFDFFLIPVSILQMYLHTFEFPIPLLQKPKSICFVSAEEPLTLITSSLWWGCAVGFVCVCFGSRDHSYLGVNLSDKRVVSQWTTLL